MIEMAKRALMLAEDLKSECLRKFSYDPETGIFIRRISYAVNARAGSVVSTMDGQGYLNSKVGGKLTGLHRLAFLMMGQEMPRLVDHVNGVRSDNRWCNLRPATPTQNCANQLNLRPKKSGFTGVIGPSASCKKFQAYVSCNKRRFYLGSHDTAEKAHAAYLDARNILFGEYDGPLRSLEAKGDE